MSVVLIGQIGSGKTTLYNKITNSNKKTQHQRNSVAINVFKNQSCFGNGFQVSDTPGLRPEQDKMEHMAGVLSALTEGPINQIFFITKYNRISFIINDVEENLNAFKNYLHMITVVITFWDYCQINESEQTKQVILHQLKQKKINSVLFFGQNESFKSICQLFDQIIGASKAEIINLIPKDIFENFDLSDCGQFDQFFVNELIEQQAFELKDYRHFSKQTCFLINESDVQEELLPDYICALTQYAKVQLEKNLKNFVNVLMHGECPEIKSYEIHHKLKTSLFMEYDKIVNYAFLKTSNGNHYSKYLKKCNHCGLIWLKVAGCTGLTACGRLLDGLEDELIKQETPPQRFNVSYNNRILKIVHNQQFQPQALQTRQFKYGKMWIDEMKVGYETIKVSRIGCQKIINWDNMFPLTSQELKYAIGMLDEKICNDISEQEKLYQERIQMQEDQYKIELEKKILEQKEKMLQAK